MKMKQNCKCILHWVFYILLKTGNTFTFIHCCKLYISFHVPSNITSCRCVVIWKNNKNMYIRAILYLFPHLYNSSSEDYVFEIILIFSTNVLSLRRAFLKDNMRNIRQEVMDWIYMSSNKSIAFAKLRMNSTNMFLFKVYLFSNFLFQTGNIKWTMYHITETYCFISRSRNKNWNIKRLFHWTEIFRI